MVSVIINADPTIVSYGRGGGVGRGLGVNAGLGVGEGLNVEVGVAVGVTVEVDVAVGVTVGVCVGVAVGVALAVVVGVAVGVGVGVTPDCAQYLPPVFKSPPGSLSPPQTIISVPVHTAVCLRRPIGAVVMSVVPQLSNAGLYLPPVLEDEPPQIIISSPLHSAV